MSLSTTAVAQSGYVFSPRLRPMERWPATSENFRRARMMLPANFNTQQITSLALRKVAETLKVSRCLCRGPEHGTPYVIYVENGSGYDFTMAVGTVAWQLNWISSAIAGAGRIVGG